MMTQTTFWQIKINGVFKFIGENSVNTKVNEKQYLGVNGSINTVLDLTIKVIALESQLREVLYCCHDDFDYPYENKTHMISIEDKERNHSHWERGLFEPFYCGVGKTPGEAIIEWKKERDKYLDRENTV